jgi:hypothetical protein
VGNIEPIGGLTPPTGRSRARAKPPGTPYTGFQTKQRGKLAKRTGFGKAAGLHFIGAVAVT